MLKLSHVKKTFNRGTVTEKRALTGVDLALADGEIDANYFQHDPYLLNFNAGHRRQRRG